MLPNLRKYAANWNAVTDILFSTGSHPSPSKSNTRLNNSENTENKKHDKSLSRDIIGYTFISDFREFVPKCLAIFFIECNNKQFTAYTQHLHGEEKICSHNKTKDVIITSSLAETDFQNCKR